MLLTSGRTASAGRRTSSRLSSELTDARSDSLWWMFETEKPFVSVGITKPRMSSSWRAHTTATSAMPPLVIHCLEPLRTQSSPSRLAFVRMPDGSEPKSGSVSPKHPIRSPAAMPGRPKAPNRAPARHARQPLLLLLLGAELPDREHRQRALHGDEAADARVAVRSEEHTSELQSHDN